jgi:predicted DNA-binding protein (MmcQ/YjbR family)
MTTSPYWAELEAHCLSFPGAYADSPWDGVVFRVPGGKIFVFSSGPRPEVSISVKVPPDLRLVLLGQPGVKVAPYVGRFGWLQITITDDATLALAKDLVGESYALNAPRRRKKQAPDTAQPD